MPTLEDIQQQFANEEEFRRATTDLPGPPAVGGPPAGRHSFEYLSGLTLQAREAAANAGMQTIMEGLTPGASGPALPEPERLKKRKRSVVGKLADVDLSGVYGLGDALKSSTGLMAKESAATGGRMRELGSEIAELAPRVLQSAQTGRPYVPPPAIRRGPPANAGDPAAFVGPPEARAGGYGPDLYRPSATQFPESTRASGNDGATKYTPETRAGRGKKIAQQVPGTESRKRAELDESALRILTPQEWARKAHPDLAMKRRLPKRVIKALREEYKMYTEVQKENGRATMLAYQLRNEADPLYPKNIPQNLEGQAGYAELTGQPEDRRKRLEHLLTVARGGTRGGSAAGRTVSPVDERAEALEVGVLDALLAGRKNDPAIDAWRAYKSPSVGQPSRITQSLTESAAEGASQVLSSKNPAKAWLQRWRASKSQRSFLHPDDQRAMDESFSTLLKQIMPNGPADLAALSKKGLLTATEAAEISAAAQEIASRGF